MFINGLSACCSAYELIIASVDLDISQAFFAASQFNLSSEIL